MRTSHLLRQMIEAFVAPFFGLYPREAPAWWRHATLFLFSGSAKAMCPRLYKLMARNGQIGAYSRSGRSGNDGEDEMKEEEEEEDDGEVPKKPKPLGILRIDDLEIPVSSYQLTIWSRAGDIDAVCPTQTILLAETHALGLVPPGRAVSVAFSERHSPDDYVRGALNAQKAGACAMVTKIDSSFSLKAASEYTTHCV